jgi:hypothetical protein
MVSAFGFTNFFTGNLASSEKAKASIMAGNLTSSEKAKVSLMVLLKYSSFLPFLHILGTISNENMLPSRS